MNSLFYFSCFSIFNILLKISGWRNGRICISPWRNGKDCPSRNERHNKGDYIVCSIYFFYKNIYIIFLLNSFQKIYEGCKGEEGAPNPWKETQNGKEYGMFFLYVIFLFFIFKKGFLYDFISCIYFLCLTLCVIFL